MRWTRRSTDSDWGTVPIDPDDLRAAVSSALSSGLAQFGIFCESQGVSDDLSRVLFGVGGSRGIESVVVDGWTDDVEVLAEIATSASPEGRPVVRGACDAAFDTAPSVFWTRPAERFTVWGRRRPVLIVADGEIARRKRERRPAADARSVEVDATERWTNQLVAIRFADDESWEVASKRGDTPVADFSRGGVEVVSDVGWALDLGADLADMLRVDLIDRT